MKINLYIILLVSCLYMINQVLKNSIDIFFLGMFFRSYYNDILCGVAFPAYCNCLLKRIGRTINYFWQIIISMFFCGLVWEIIPPVFLKFGVSDIIDIICYEAGGIIYWLIYRGCMYFSDTKLWRNCKYSCLAKIVMGFIAINQTNAWLK